MRGPAANAGTARATKARAGWRRGAALLPARLAQMAFGRVFQVALGEGGSVVPADAGSGHGLGSSNRSVAAPMSEAQVSNGDASPAGMG
jgi:hypothetical protein